MSIKLKPNDIELNPFAQVLRSGKGLEEAHTSMQAEMEAMSENLRRAILKCDPKQLLGFLWGQLLMGQLGRGEGAAQPQEKAALDDLMFTLEYVHAVLSSHVASDHGKSSATEDVHAVLDTAVKLRMHSLMYCMVAARRTPDGLFGPETSTVAMHAMTSWVTLRGHRYQGLEAEFFEFVLRPHDAAFRQVYGIGAVEIAAGVQAAVDATRYGHMRAAEILEQEAAAAYALAEAEGLELGEAIQKIYGGNEGQQNAAHGAITDMLFGGLCNVTKSSGLPHALLADLSWVPGEEKEFFAEGALRGTPLRRLPGRVKPFVALDDGCYACDANFMRDSTYRALQWALLRRLDTYKQEWTDRQTALTEGAFAQIFEKQLAGAEVLTSVYYPDPETGKWVENDVLILLNDALLQLEVKAGVMPMHSPEVHFERHVRSIQDLVVKAHHQCERFLKYLASGDELPVYKLIDGSHQEVRRLRLADYRLVVPIGLTVEAFTPFSSMSKRLPEVRPILGKHPFVSMSIDDLFVLSRFLPTAGELIHYLSVRQGVAGLKEAFVFDELDHLGSYIERNRSDMFYESELAGGAGLIAHADACQPIDDYFADPEWPSKPPPRQNFPAVLRDVLQAIDVSRGARFLEADAAVRDMAFEAREDMARNIEKLIPTLAEYPFRWFSLVGDEPLMVWVQRASYVDLVGVHKAKAEAVALSMQAPRCKVLMVYVKADRSIAGAWARYVDAPHEGDSSYGSRLVDGQRIKKRAMPLTPEGVARLFD